MTNIARIYTLVIALLSMGSFLPLQAQNQTNYWYFGNKAGLNFNFSPPRVWNNSQMNAYGGGVTVSDSAGKLLFYTDGKTVWNNRHWIIGQGIRSNIASNSVRALKGQVSTYHLFSLETLFKSNSRLGNRRYFNLYRSTIDLAANQGKGKLVAKNQLIQQNFTSGIVAIERVNEQDAWIIVRDTVNTFYAYLIDRQGRQSKVVKSSLGKVIPPTEVANKYLTQLKVSPQGNKVAMLYRLNVILLFDFDPDTGKFSNPQILKGERKTDFQYVEFSSNGQKLYASAIAALSKYNADVLYQFDLKDPKNVERTLISTPKYVSYIRGLQLAKNGKIYVAQGNYTHLGVIEYPNKAGKLCAYTPKGIYLKGRTARMGLPAFSARYFSPTRKITVGKPFVRNIEFAYNKAVIRPQYYQLLDDIAEFLNKKTTTKVKVTGHTDNIGPTDRNLVLSKQRAQSVANYLIKKGVAKERINTDGKGDQYPIANNQSAKGRKRNRRIEFLIK